MKFMTYNILHGGKDGLSFIIDVVNKESPDYLTINEANGWSDNNGKILKFFANQTNFDYFDISLSGEQDYHLAVFSKYEFKQKRKIHPLRNAGLFTVIESEIGSLAIASAHLTPYAEEQRLKELEIILKLLKPSKNFLLMGDLNSLSRKDGYNQAIIKSFNDEQIKKFTHAGKLCFEVTDKLAVENYIDSAVFFGKNKEQTAPTSINEHLAHSNMRLDYIFVSKSLTARLGSYQVIKNRLTEESSDHYPIILTLQ